MKKSLREQTLQNIVQVGMLNFECRSEFTVKKIKLKITFLIPSQLIPSIRLTNEGIPPDLEFIDKDGGGCTACFFADYVLDKSFVP